MHPVAVSAVGNDVLGASHSRRGHDSHSLLRDLGGELMHARILAVHQDPSIVEENVDADLKSCHDTKQGFSQPVKPPGGMQHGQRQPSFRHSRAMVIFRRGEVPRMTLPTTAKDFADFGGAFGHRATSV